MKGNVMARTSSLMVLVALALTHFSGQANLLAPTWLWLAGFVGFMTFQATFTGFCPASRLMGSGKGSSCCGG